MFKNMPPQYIWALGGGGGGGISTVTLTTTVKDSSVQAIQDVTVTVSYSGGSNITGTTNSNGVCVLSVKAGYDYHMTVSKDGYISYTANVHVDADGKDVAVTLMAKPVVTVVQTGATGIVSVSGGTYTVSDNVYTLDSVNTAYTFSVSAVSGYATPAPQTVTLAGDAVQTLTFVYSTYPIVTVTQTGATGILSCSPTAVSQVDNSFTLLPDTSYTFSVSDVTGYFTPTSQTVSYNAGTTNSITFAYTAKPVLTVTVTGEGAENLVVSATNGTDTVTGATDTNGVAVMTLNGTGTYTVSVPSPPTGSTVDPQTISASAGGTPTCTLTIVYAPEGWTFGMEFNATTFQTDPTGCLTYTDDLSGATPILNTATSLATASNYSTSSWYMKPDGTSDNAMLNECFYATFHDNGSGALCLHEKLNPNDLTQKIAEWDNTNKTWTTASGTSSITSENTMFCIPTAYMKGTSSSFVISSDSAEGDANAHTIGGTTYDYLAIGVYLSQNNSNVLRSVSGVQASGSITRANFRTYAHANTVQNGIAMQWNWHQWELMRMLCYFATKSFACQQRIGQGGHSYSTRQTGATNALGPFAGNVSGTTDHMKCFIEEFWGCQYQFVDDVYNNGTDCYVGQNASPTDDTTNKTALPIFAYSGGGFPTAILTDTMTWGCGTNTSGTKDTGLCDYQNIGSTSDPVLLVGGSSGNVSNGNAGPACWARSDLSYANGSLGARLAFVFNP